MKALTLSLTVLGVAVVGTGLLWQRSSPMPRMSTGTTNPIDQKRAASASSAQTLPRVQIPLKAESNRAGLAERRNFVPTPTQIPPHTPTSLSIHAKFESLLDPHTGFEQKQAVWSELTKSGKLDLAIAELEQRAKDNPSNADIPACLGRGYLQKAGSIQDVREQGILGMKADQTFEAALALDPQNWDARYWKATAMSYWPVQLNKTPEVVDELLALVDQQEKTTARPEFAQSYVLLGEQYEKSGHTDYAKQTWQRGLTQFPDYSQLKDKLARQP
jgi:tetratricopeptide (TPR) repeat protein